MSKRIVFLILAIFVATLSLVATGALSAQGEVENTSSPTTSQKTFPKDQEFGCANQGGPGFFRLSMQNNLTLTLQASQIEAWITKDGQEVARRPEAPLSPEDWANVGVNVSDGTHGQYHGAVVFYNENGEEWDKHVVETYMDCSWKTYLPNIQRPVPPPPDDFIVTMQNQSATGLRFEICSESEDFEPEFQSSLDGGQTWLEPEYYQSYELPPEHPNDCPRWMYFPHGEYDDWDFPETVWVRIRLTNDGGASSWQVHGLWVFQDPYPNGTPTPVSPNPQPTSTFPPPNPPTPTPTLIPPPPAKGEVGHKNKG